MKDDGNSCPHLLLAHAKDEDEAMPRKAEYQCSRCGKKVTIEFEEETYWDVQNSV